MDAAPFEYDRVLVGAVSGIIGNKKRKREEEEINKRWDLDDRESEGRVKRTRAGGTL